MVNRCLLLSILLSYVLQLILFFFKHMLAICQFLFEIFKNVFEISGSSSHDNRDSHFIPLAKQSLNTPYIQENFGNGRAGGLVQAEPDPHGHVETVQRYTGPKATRTEEQGRLIIAEYICCQTETNNQTTGLYELLSLSTILSTQTKIGIGRRLRILGRRSHIMRCHIFD